VKHILKGAGVYNQILPSYLSEFLNEKSREHHVDVRPNSSIRGISSLDDEGSKAVIQLENGDSIEVDHVGKY
jgi:hypothetical protein